MSETRYAGCVVPRAVREPQSMNQAYEPMRFHFGPAIHVSKLSIADERPIIAHRGSRPVQERAMSLVPDEPLHMLTSLPKKYYNNNGLFAAQPVPKHSATGM